MSPLWACEQTLWYPCPRVGGDLTWRLDSGWVVRWEPKDEEHKGCTGNPNKKHRPFEAFAPPPHHQADKVPAAPQLGAGEAKGGARHLAIDSEMHPETGVVFGVAFWLGLTGNSWIPGRDFSASLVSI